MTTLAEARDELVAAFDAAGYRATDNPGAIDTPFVAVLGEGIATERIVMGKAAASFRVALVAGQADASGTVADLDTLKLAALALLRPLAGWQLGPVRPDFVRRLAGADYLTADVVATRLIDL